MGTLRRMVNELILKLCLLLFLCLSKFMYCTAKIIKTYCLLHCFHFHEMSLKIVTILTLLCSPLFVVSDQSEIFGKNSSLQLQNTTLLIFRHQHSDFISQYHFLLRVLVSTTPRNYDSLFYYTALQIRTHLSKL